MMFRFGWLPMLLVFPALSLAGGKAIEVGSEGWETKAEVKADDPKLKMDFMGKIFLMPAKQYDLKLEAGSRFRFTLDTDDPKLDPFLVIKDLKGEVIVSDDDGGGRLNSKLTFAPFNETGMYQVFAASLHGQPGTITLKVSALSKFHVDPVVHVFKKDPLRLKGELTEDRHEIHYQVRLKAGKSYCIDMTAGKLDSFLELKDDLGRPLAEDDDGGGKLDARITKSIAKEGLYRVIASSTNLTQTGPFILEIREE